MNAPGAPVNGDMTFLTPTYLPDLERFQLQRESMERCGITIPHVAVVHDEDVRAFRAIPYQNNLTIVSTSDILPAKIEARRRNWGRRRRDPRYWLARPPIHGWGTQQLCKLASPTVIDTEGIVCLDSDTFFIRHVEPGDFRATDGRLHLYETVDDVDAEMGEWTIKSMRFLGAPVQHEPVRRYTHVPFALHRQVLLDLQAFIEDRHRKHWMSVILETPLITEYATYGVYARYVDGLMRHAPVRPPLCTYFWWPEQIEALRETFRDRVQQDASKMVVIHSSARHAADTYRDLVQDMWNGTG